MKKIILSSLLAFAMSSMVANNTLKIESVAIQPTGEGEIKVELVNSNDINALDFTLILPTGMDTRSRGIWNEEDEEYNYFIGTANRKYSNDTWTFEKNQSGNLKVIYFNSNSGRKLKGSEGTLCTLYIKVDKSYVGGDILIDEDDYSFAYDGEEVNCEIDNTPISSIGTTTIGKGGMSSFSYAINVKVDGATAYYGVFNNNNDALVLTTFEDNIVPANTGAVLIGEEGTAISLSSAASNASNLVNDLHPSVSGKEVSANTTYVIATNPEDQKTGFYKYSGTKIPAGKAYLDVPSGPAKASIRVITNATGIDELESEESAIDAYDLFGNKVENANGQIVIENGKKIIRK